MFKWRDAQVLVRLFIALAAVVGSMLLFRFMLLPGLQSVFDLGDTVTTVLRRSGMLLFALIGYWAYVRLVEKREVSEIRIAPGGMALGLLSGAALISIRIGLISKAYYTQ